GNQDSERARRNQAPPQNGDPHLASITLTAWPSLRLRLPTRITAWPALSPLAISTLAPSLNPVLIGVFRALFSTTVKTDAPALSVTTASTGTKSASSFLSMPILTI